MFIRVSSLIIEMSLKQLMVIIIHDGNIHTVYSIGAELRRDRKREKQMHPNTRQWLWVCAFLLFAVLSC